jgi:hypothetical protein
LNTSSPPLGAAVYNSAGSTAHIRNTIIVGNTAPSASKDVVGTFISDGYNLIGTTTGSTGFGSTGDQIGATAAQVNLGPLQDNGGLTKTMAPKTGSIAIDQGSSGGLTTDQRGDPRPVNRTNATNVPGDSSDIGAVEVGLSQFPQAGAMEIVTNTDEHNEHDCRVDDCTLAEAIEAGNFIAANASLGPVTIKFAPGLSGVILNTTVPTGLNIAAALTIIGPGARVLTISGNKLARVFNVTGGTGNTVNISGLTIANGQINDSGGGIFNSANLHLLDCTVVNNSGGSGAGAVNVGTLYVTNCTFAGNVSTGHGGALRNVADLIVRNSTFNNNTAISSGAITSFVNSGPAATLNITNCTISGNKASDTSGGTGGGIFNGNLSTGTVSNTIVANNTAATGTDVSGTFTSGGPNLIRIATGSTGFTNGNNGDQVGIPAGLDTLKNNGGPTDTMALLSSSTAINNGGANAPSTDQRGAVRVGVSDIGAFEFDGIPPAPPTVTTNAATNVGTTSATLNATVNPNGLPTSFQFTSDFTSFAAQDAGSGTASVPFSINVTGLSPNTQYHFRAVAMSNGVTIQGTEQVFTTPSPGLIGNVSTRLPVGTGDNVLIEGFIVQGPAGSTKKIIVRAIGPSLIPFGIADALANPTLEIHDASNATVATNDNWRTTQIGGLITSDQATEISASGLAPGNDLESAIIASLAPGSYTAIVRGSGDTVGTGVVDAYDLSAGSAARLANIATRGLIQPGDKLMIAGFIIQNGPVRAVIRAIGPSLVAFGITNALADTTLQLRDQNGAIVVENDNWKVRSDGSSQQAELEATGLQPTNDLEAAVLTTLPPGQYTAQVRGKPESTGIGVVQVYFLQ